MYRGCLSDPSEARLMCELDAKHQNGTCKKCATSGCNDEPKFDRPKLSCVKCSNDEECAFGRDAAEAKQCTKDVMFGEKESCFVHAISGNTHFIYSKFINNFQSDFIHREHESGTWLYSRC